MPKTPITYRTIMSIGLDAGNRSMRAAGRSVWNEDDYQACVTATDPLWPHAEENRDVWPDNAPMTYDGEVRWPK